MELRLTLLDPEHLDAPVDVLIEAPAGTPVEAVSDQLAATLGMPMTPDLQIVCARQPVGLGQPLGLPPLLQGATLTLVTDPSRVEAGRPPAPLEAHVISGPDAGSV